jgi:flagellar biosynthesis/type III secretory pathway M-ring protein FliF/YscJ
MDLLSTPITKDLDVKHLFLLVGIVIISIAVWAVLLSYITRGVQAVASEV